MQRVGGSGTSEPAGEAGVAALGVDLAALIEHLPDGEATRHVELVARHPGCAEDSRYRV